MLLHDRLAAAGSRSRLVPLRIGNEDRGGESGSQDLRMIQFIGPGGFLGRKRSDYTSKNRRRVGNRTREVSRLLAWAYYSMDGMQCMVL